MGQLLRYALRVKGQADGVDDHEYLATVFVDAVRQCLKDGGYARKDGDQESGGTFIVGYRGHIYSIEGDYQVAQSLEGFEAVGSGYEIARGSLCETDGIAPHERVRRALQAAERFSAGVRGPFNIVSSAPTLATMPDAVVTGHG
jgi:ATP-dependent protease HslVU (ClpYQ) peptidase subunit